MKKVVCVLICVILIISLCGCAVSIEETKESADKNTMFVRLGGTSEYYIVYHRDTKVMYAVSDGSYNRGVFTLLVDSDGSPLLYEGGAE